MANIDHKINKNHNSNKILDFPKFNFKIDWFRFIGCKYYYPANLQVDVV